MQFGVRDGVPDPVQPGCPINFEASESRCYASALRIGRLRTAYVN